MKKICKAISFWMCLSGFCIFCLYNAEAADTSDENGFMLNAMDYCENWEELVYDLEMTQIDSEYSIGDTFETDAISIEISSWGGIILRNRGNENLSIDGVTFADTKAEIQGKLENSQWMRSWSGDHADYYITRRNEGYYYLEISWMEENREAVSSWCLLNYTEEENANEKRAAYEAYLISDAEWKKAYIKYIFDLESEVDDPWTTVIYSLIKVDEDNIPELYINLGSTAAGSQICTLFNNEVVSQFVWNFGFSYLEKQNLFHEQGGHMDAYYDRIYTIKDGTFELVGEGRYGAPDNSSVQMNEEGSPFYEYYWDGEMVSETQYQESLILCFNEMDAINPYEGAEYDSDQGRYTGNGLCDYYEMLDVISYYGN